MPTNGHTLKKYKGPKKGNGLNLKFSAVAINRAVVKAVPSSKCISWIINDTEVAGQNVEQEDILKHVA